MTRDEQGWPYDAMVAGPSDDKGQAVPLVELLCRVPSNAHYREYTPNPLGFDTTHYPVGRLCHEAAARITALQARVEAANRTLAAIASAMLPPPINAGELGWLEYIPPDPLAHLRMMTRAVQGALDAAREGK